MKLYKYKTHTQTHPNTQTHSQTHTHSNMQTDRQTDTLHDKIENHLGDFLVYTDSDSHVIIYVIICNCLLLMAKYTCR